MQFEAMAQTDTIAVDPILKLQPAVAPWPPEWPPSNLHQLDGRDLFPFSATAYRSGRGCLKRAMSHRRLERTAEFKNTDAILYLVVALQRSASNAHSGAKQTAVLAVLGRAKIER